MIQLGESSKLPLAGIAGVSPSLPFGRQPARWSSPTDYLQHDRWQLGPGPAAPIWEHQKLQRFRADAVAVFASSCRVAASPRSQTLHRDLAPLLDVGFPHSARLRGGRSHVQDRGRTHSLPHRLTANRLSLCAKNDVSAGSQPLARLDYRVTQQGGFLGFASRV